MQEFEGILKGEGARIAIVVSRFNGFISEALLSGAIDGNTLPGLTNSSAAASFSISRFMVMQRADAVTPREATET